MKNIIMPKIWSDNMVNDAMVLDTKTELAKVAIETTPDILKEMGLACEKFEKPICDVLKITGCKDQIAFVQGITKTIPEFLKYTDQFWKILSDTLSVYTVSSSKNYEAIVKAVVDSDTSIDEKVQHVMEIEDSRTNNIKMILLESGKIIICVGSVIAASFFFREGSSVITTLIKEGGKVLRSPAGNIFKIIKLLKK